MPRLIYVDSGVLLAAARGVDEIAQEAFAVLDDPDVQFALTSLRRSVSQRWMHSTWPPQLP